MMKVERNSSADVVLNSEHSQSTLFWKPSVLELVEEVLRPPEGGSPYLPEYSDAVKLYLSLSLFLCIYLPCFCKLLCYDTKVGYFKEIWPFWTI